MTGTARILKYRADGSVVDEDELPRICEDVVRRGRVSSGIWFSRSKGARLAHGGLSTTDLAKFASRLVTVGCVEPGMMRGVTSMKLEKTRLLLVIAYLRFSAAVGGRE